MAEAMAEAMAEVAPEGIAIEPMRAEDGPAVLAIYEEGVATGNATFERSAPSWEAWDRDHLEACRLVARGPSGALLGWIALSGVSGRCVYAGVAEASLYIAASARGRGVGRALLRALIEAAEAEGFWTLQAGIFPENAASLALFRSEGFRDVGVRERLGRMPEERGGAWRDVVVLERRSAVVGV